MSYPGSPIETPDAWIERNPYDEQHDPDEGVYDQFPNQSLDTGTESPNESTETGLDLDKTESFSAWLDAKGDSLATPESFDQWLKEHEDSI